MKNVKTEDSAIAEHVWVHKHQVDFQSLSVLARELNLHRRLALESWFIRRSATINREARCLSSVYDSLT